MSRVVGMLVHNLADDRLNDRAVWRKRADFLTLPKEIAKVLIISFTLPLILSACAIKGDFGRPQPTIIGDVVDLLLPGVTHLFESHGGPDVTYDEMAMRESGYLLAPPLTPVRGGALAPMTAPAMVPNPVLFTTAVRQN